MDHWSFHCFQFLYLASIKYNKYAKLVEQFNHHAFILLTTGNLHQLYARYYVRC
jgi:hypothetical protein